MCSAAFLCSDLYVVVICFSLNLLDCDCVHYVTNFLCLILCFPYITELEYSDYFVNSIRNMYHLLWEAGKVWEDVLTYAPVCFTTMCESLLLLNLYNFCILSTIKCRIVGCIL